MECDVYVCVRVSPNIADLYVQCCVLIHEFLSQLSSELVVDIVLNPE